MTAHITIPCILTGLCFSDINKQGTVASPFAGSELLQFKSWGMLKDERYSNAPQAEDDRDESVHNLDKINVLDMMSVNQIKPVLAP